MIVSIEQQSYYCKPHANLNQFLKTNIYIIVGWFFSSSNQ